MVKKFFIAGCLALLFVCVSSSAQENDLNGLNGEDHFFSVEDANRIYDQLSIKLSTQNLVVSDLKEAVDELGQLKEGADQCVSSAKSDLVKVDSQIKSIKNITVGDPSTDIDYLQKKHDQLNDRAAACHLFSIRAQDAIQAYHKTIDSMETAKLLAKTSSIATNLKQFPSLIMKLPSEIDWQKMLDESGILLFSATQSMVFIAVLVVVFGLAVLIRAAISHFIESEEAQSKIALSIICTFNRYIVYLLPLATISLCMTLLSWDDPVSYLTNISYALIIYTCLLFVFRSIFYPPRPAEGVSEIPLHIRKSLFNRVYVLATLVLIAFVWGWMISPQNIPEQTAHIFTTIWLSFFSISLISIVWLVTDTSKLQYQQKFLRWSLVLVLSLCLLTILGIEWIGYHHLAVFIVRGITYSLAAFFIAWFLHRAVHVIIESLNRGQSSWQLKMRYYLGVKPNVVLPEFVLTGIVAYLVIWIGFVGAMLNIWGVSTVRFNQLYDQMMNGVIIADVSFYPARIMIGILVFSILGLISRLISSRISRHSRHHMERGAQVELASISNYVGFSIAILIAMLLSGVNFTGLAIVAGALSVGIGFGLQNIVNNFVSGVILLIERPIRPGDRIIIGQTEGFVHKISIRATQIRTVQCSDVMVPNSELISQQVTNYMFRDRNWRITCSVGVAYGSDVELVKDLLQKVAANHPDTKKDAPDEPIILFREFGNSSLVFDLWCVIRDVNRKYLIQSELNFEINKLFKENGITIAFPQLDLHVKNWAPPSSS